jgi:hypothetical protein
LLVGGKNAGKARGLVEICALPGDWQLVGLPPSKQGCALGIAEAVGAVATITTAAAAASRGPK